MLVGLIFLGYLTITSASNTYATKSGLIQGTTTIDGGCITTGTIDASKVTVKNLDASKITTGTLSANRISGGSLDLTGKNTTITSTNFSVDKNGNITSTGGTIGGFTLGTNQFSANLVSEKMAKYTYTEADRVRLQNIIMEEITPTPTDYDKYDFNYSGQFTARDYLILTQIINGTQNGKATFFLDTKKSEKALSIKNSNGKEVVNLGLFGSYINYLSAGNLDVSGALFADGGITMQNVVSLITQTYNNMPYGYFELRNTSIRPTIEMDGQTGHIDCVSITPSSVAEKKKNFEKLDSGLDIIKDIDIYEYNMKDEEDTTKKHIGFVIGDKFNYNEKITSQKNDGADLYSFISVCCKAIQEQQEEIEELKEQIKVLEER